MISSENNAIVLPSQDYVFDAILEACNFPFSTTGLMCFFFPFTFSNYDQGDAFSLARC